MFSDIPQVYISSFKLVCFLAFLKYIQVLLSWCVFYHSLYMYRLFKLVCSHSAGIYSFWPSFIAALDLFPFYFLKFYFFIIIMGLWNLDYETYQFNKMLSLKPSLLFSVIQRHLCPRLTVFQNSLNDNTYQKLNVNS